MSHAWALSRLTRVGGFDDGRLSAIHPARRAIDVVFLLPDRDVMLDLVDDLPAGRECLGAVRACDADPYRQIADLECTQAVPAVCPQRAMAPNRFGNDAIALVERKFFEGLIFESRNRPAVVVITDPALE
jgi:hypothetical protein